MATKRTPADIDPVIDVDPDPAADLGQEPDVEPDVTSDVDPDAATAAPGNDDEAAIVTGTWFKWETSEGLASAAHGHVVIAAPAVIEQGIAMGLLTRL